MSEEEKSRTDGGSSVGDAKTDAQIIARRDTLYNLSGDLQAVLDGCYVLDEDTGEIIWEPSQIDDLQLAVADKAEAVACVLKGKQAFAAALKCEIEQLQKRLKSAKSNAERMEDYLLRCVAMNGGRIDTPKASISTRKSTSLEVLDESAVPDEFKREKVTYAIDKLAAKAAIKRGEDVPGCAMVIKEHLQIG